MFQAGVSGFHIKSGEAFKSWTKCCIRAELLKGENLASEVQRLVERKGRYVLLCTGHDLNPKQRNDSRKLITQVLAEAGFPQYEDRIEVLAASQLAEFAERYPGTAEMLRVDPIEEAWVLEEWQRDAHLSNTFEASTEQEQVIEQVRARLRGEAKHMRVLGESPALEKRALFWRPSRLQILPLMCFTCSMAQSSDKPNSLADAGLT